MKRAAFSLILGLVLLFPVGLSAEQSIPHPPDLQPAEAPAPPPGDPLSRGLWWLYHLQYEKAHDLFQRYCDDHPQDPAGYFYKTATDWWQLAQQFDYKLPEIEARLERDYQDTARVGREAVEKAKSKEERGYGYLYWGGAEGLKGRWLVTQKQWVKAYFLGKRGSRFLKRALANDPSLYDADMGLGIYDYFTDTLSGVVGAVSALLIHGDKHRGLRELQTAIDKSRHARVESMIFLIEIYTSEENQPEKALPLTRELRKEFPASPAMHLANVMALYGMKDWEPMIVEAKSFLEKSRAETPWYTPSGVRPALYVLGVGEFWGHHNNDAALGYFEEILKGGVDSSRWVTFAYLRRGQIRDLKGRRDAALEDYKQVLSRPEFWGSRKEAAGYIEKPFKD